MKGTYFTRRVWTNAAASMGALIATMASQALLSYLMARMLGPRSFGAATLAFTVLLVAVEIMVFGSDGHGVRWIASGASTDPRAPGQLLTFRLLNAALVMAVLYATLAVFPFSGEERAFIAILAAGLPFGAVVTSVGTSLYGREQFGAFAGLTAAFSLAGLVCAGAALGAGATLPQVGAILVFLRALAALASAALHRRRVGPLRPGAPGPAYRSLLRPSAPYFWIAVLATVHLKANVPLVRALRGVEDLGLYGLAATVAGAAAVFVQPLSGSLFPAVARAGGAGAVLQGRRALRTLLIPLTVGLAGGLAIFAAAEPLVILTLGSAYAGSVPPLRILSAFVPLLYVSSTALRMMLACGHTAAALRILAVNIAVNLSVNLLLIPRMGIRGAAIASVVSAVASAAQGVRFLARLPQGPVAGAGAAR